ncbi:hypothetical protein [Cohnella yongneupensis]|uniref:Uncharacterized protein n=1 Tax=Cohnella yongneupensis TaxID=425006 RepID=A0ABW0QUG9_9BACL
MQSLARNGFSSAQVKKALHAANRQIDFRYELVNASNQYIRDLTTITEASVSVSIESEIKRTARFTLLDDGSVNFLSDRIKPYVRVMIPRSASYGRTIFYDDFETGLNGWSTAGSGVISASTVGTYKTLKKTVNGDPNGGTKALSVTVNDFDLSAFVYRESISGSNGTRIGLEDPSGNGYGISIGYASTPSDSTISIVRRASSSLTTITPTTNLTVNINQWYTFRLSKRGNVITASVYNGRITDFTSGLIASMSIIDDTYNTFNTVVVRGGTEFHVDDLRVVDKQDTGFVEFPLGVFLLATPKRKSDQSGQVTRNIEAYDQLQVLRDDRTTGQYLIAANTGYIAAVKTLLDSAGITLQNLTPSSKVIPVDREWDGGTPRLTIINDLLSALNYNPLFFDENGVAVAWPYITPDQRAAEYTYADNQESVIFPEVEETLDLFDIPNQFVLIVSQPDRAVLKSIYTNSNPASLTSTVNRGRTITTYLPVDAVDQTTLDNLAQAAAFKASQVYQAVTFETAIMPQHSYNDVYNFQFSRLGISEKYEEIGWTLPMKSGGQMEHTIRRVVSV